MSETTMNNNQAAIACMIPLVIASVMYLMRKQPEGEQTTTAIAVGALLIGFALVIVHNY
jgi:hypothetical protein